MENSNKAELLPAKEANVVFWQVAMSFQEESDTQADYFVLEALILKIIQVSSPIRKL